MIISGDGPERKITPSVWSAFTVWYGQLRAARAAQFVEQLEELVREQVAADIAARGLALREDDDEGISREEWACYDDAATIARNGVASG